LVKYRSTANGEGGSGILAGGIAGGLRQLDSRPEKQQEENEWCECMLHGTAKVKPLPLWPEGPLNRLQTGYARHKNYEP
jgi:hypothetical protein